MTRLPLLSLLACLLLAAGCAHSPARVAVLNFQNATGEPRYDFLEKALPEYLVARLSCSPRATVLERQPARLYADSPSDARKDRQGREWLVHTLQAADYFVVGSVSRLERNFILTARLCDAGSGQVVEGTAVTQTCIREQDLYVRMQSMALFLADRLGAHGVQTPLARAAASGVPPEPPSPESGPGGDTTAEAPGTAAPPPAP